MRTHVVTMAFLFATGCSLQACASEWREVDSVEAFAEAFDADRGKVRIVLLLSPT